MIKYFTKHLVFRYAISGSVSTFVDLLMLSLLYYVFNVYYIFASIAAFLMAFIASLILHKFWTFRNHCMDDFNKQAWKYLISSIFILLMNTYILYICVDTFHMYVILGQIVAGALTVGFAFFISRDHIFNQQKATQ